MKTKMKLFKNLFATLVCVALCATLFVSCDDPTPEPENRLTGTVWEHRASVVTFRLEFFDIGKVRNSIISISTGETTSTHESEYTVVSGHPLVSQRAELRLEDRPLLTQQRMIIENNTLMWERREVFGLQRTTFTLVK